LAYEKEGSIVLNRQKNILKDLRHFTALKDEVEN